MHQLALVVFLIVASLFSGAQSLSVGVFSGISNYQGDLIDKVFTKSATKGAGGITAAYQLNEHWSLRGGFAFTKMIGSDRYNTKTYLQTRNLSFSTSVSEFSLVGEFATFDLDIRRLTPYLFGGVALYHFNPYTFDSAGKKLFLKPLSTEGQGLSGYPSSKPYALTQLALPFGGGFRYAVNDAVRVGVELGIRKLFTDHLDDLSGSYVDAADLLRERGPVAVAYAYRGDEVPGGTPTYPTKGAQRGGASQKDWYYLAGVTLSYRLGGGNTLFGTRGKRSNTGCPASPL